MEKEKIIEKNRERLRKISAVYNPITGEGSTSVPRLLTNIEGFPIENLNLPSSMQDEILVKQLVELGASGYLREITQQEPNSRNIIRVWLNF